MRRIAVNKRSMQGIIETADTSSLARCAKICALHMSCVAMNFKRPNNGQVLCELLDSIDVNGLSHQEDWMLYAVVNRIIS